ncbi:MAG: ECF transporter S component [Eubacteriales bacterium]|nr:ECF transporter S component [Eubacteriales bacterium]
MSNTTTVSTKKQFNTKYMVQLAVMVAIIFIMSFTPLGYIQLPAIKITFLTVPVAVGAILLGPAGGAVCGLAFGLTSFYQCFGMSPLGTLLLSISPFGTFVTAVVTRVIEGFLTGLIFKALHNLPKVSKISYYVASLSCPILNTVLYMGSLVLFFYHAEPIRALAPQAANPLIFIVTVVGIQAVIEAVVCFIVASIISRTLYAVLKKDM